MSRRADILDENVPAQLRRFLGDHVCTTVAEEGWSGAKDGRLLILIEREFDVLITADRNIAFQQNLKGRSLSIVTVPTNRRKVLLALAPVIQQVLQDLQSGTDVVIDSTGSVIARPR